MVTANSIPSRRTTPLKIARRIGVSRSRSSQTSTSSSRSSRYQRRPRRSGHNMKLATVFGALAIASCASETGAARDAFVHSVTCPADRVSVVLRSDIKPKQASTSTPPPPDIAADPERLRLWHEQQDAPAPHSCNAYEVTGCGQRLLLCCYTELATSSASASTGKCLQIDDRGFEE